MLGGELSGKFEQLIITALQASQETFDPEFHTEKKMNEDVEKLYKMGQGVCQAAVIFVASLFVAMKLTLCFYLKGKWGTDEGPLFKFLCASPPQFLSWINTTYADKYGLTIPKVLEKELSGTTEKAAVHLVMMKIKPFEAVAHLIKSACKGIGTNE